ncbi:MAG: alpha/beta fold hydrolase [Caldilineaceae bacterium]|nr:alpha/beta fold hydrolase [Caldilineaceae bacterium]
MREIAAVSIEHRHIQVGAAWVHYQTAGAGPPLVLVHGLASSTRWWRRNMAALAAHFRVYAVDLHEFGNRRLRPRFVLAQAAHYLARWLDAVGLVEQVNLIGHSMGGRIVAELAAEQPNRVGRLVLVNAAILPFGRGYWQQSLGMMAAFQRIHLSLLRVLLWDTLRTGVVPVLRVGRELFKSHGEAWLAQIQAPTLILWGEHDTVVPLALGQSLHERLAGSQFQLIHGAAHVPMWERPTEFNRRVLEFLLATPLLTDPPLPAGVSRESR